MWIRMRVQIAVLFLLALAGFPGTLAAQPGSLPSGIYRLDAGSTEQAGCFPPCLCPIQAEMPVFGTLTLGFVGSDPLFDTYEVRDVNWTVGRGNTELRVVGSGSYRIGGEVALVQQLELDLSIDDNPVQHFDSGLVIAGGVASIDVAISRNGMVCRDVVFVVRASPVPRSEIQRYRLDNASAFQRGCVGMCDCLAGAPLPIRGTFELVDVAPDPPLSELLRQFALVNVRWRVDLDGAGPDGPVPVTGSGSYVVGGEFALQQRMQLDLDIGAEPTARFDSGLVVGGASFPRIEIPVASGDPNCFETVIDVQARPIRKRRRR